MQTPDYWIKELLVMTGDGVISQKDAEKILEDLKQKQTTEYNLMYSYIQKVQNDARCNCSK